MLGSHFIGLYSFVKILICLCLIFLGNRQIGQLGIDVGVGFLDGLLAETAFRVQDCQQCTHVYLFGLGEQVEFLSLRGDLQKGLEVVLIVEGIVQSLALQKLLMFGRELILFFWQWVARIELIFYPVIIIKLSLVQRPIGNDLSILIDVLDNFAIFRWHLDFSRADNLSLLFFGFSQHLISGWRAELVFERILQVFAATAHFLILLIYLLFFRIIFLLLAILLLIIIYLVVLRGNFIIWITVRNMI